MTSIVFRVDASNDIGRGHAMRCLTLANTLRQWNVRSTFICCQLPGDLIAFIESFDYLVYSFNQGSDEVQTLNLLDQIGQVDVLILDHYDLGLQWEQAVKAKVPCLMVFDDLANREHTCDMLLDPSFARTPGDYNGLLGNDCLRLIGPHYLLIADEYSKSRFRALEHRRSMTKLERVLISFGGSDNKNATSFVIDALNKVSQGLVLDVVVGSHWPHLDMIKQSASQSRHDIRLSVDQMGLAELILQADLAIGAGGLSVYERCCLGLPSLLITIADNQTYNAQRLDEIGAVMFLGSLDEVSSRSVSDAVLKLSLDTEKRKTMSHIAASVCDGYGSNRVAAELLHPFDEVALRPVTIADSEIMFVWQQEPSTRKYARNPQVPAREEHDQWFVNKLKDPNCLFNIITVLGQPAGILRFDRVKQSDRRFEISILVGPEFRRQGVALKALQLSRKIFPNLIFYAEVHPDNTASHDLFLAANFVYEEAGYVCKPDFMREVVL